MNKADVVTAIGRQIELAKRLGNPNIFFSISEANMLIDLLKEQEAVEPILEQDSMVCGVCGHEVIWQKMLGDGIWVDEKLDYCPHCGRLVKWNDEPRSN